MELHPVDAKFESELRKRSISFSRNEDGVYEIPLGEGTVNVSLHKAYADYEETQSTDLMDLYIESILEMDAWSEITWEEARPRLEFFIGPLDVQGLDEGVVHEPIDSNITVMYAIQGSGDTRAWLTESQIERWGVEVDEAKAIARENTKSKIDALELSPVDFRGRTIYAVDGGDNALYFANLLFSERLKSLAEPLMGWPVHGFLPATDEVFLAGGLDETSFGDFGNLVFHYFHDNPYGLSTGIYEFSDEGFRVIGEFAMTESELDESEEDE